MTKEQINTIKMVSSTNGAGTTVHLHAKKMNLDRHLIFFTKIKSSGS